MNAAFFLDESADRVGELAHLGEGAQAGREREAPPDRPASRELQPLVRLTLSVVAIDRNACAAGMAAQIAAFEQALARGMPRLGWKVGLNVAAVQRGLGLRHAAVGWIDGNRLFRDGERLTPPSEALLHVEAEICIHLAEGVSSSSTPDKARACIASVSPALEIVDYMRPTTGGIDSILAHSMFHHATVVGAPAAVAPVAGLGVEWPRLWMNDREVAAPDPRAAVPADLGELLVFVASFLEMFAQSLEAGDRILSGSFITPVALPSPSQVVARFGSLGSVALHVIEPESA